MSITLKLNLPAGRYHATPWGRHVNEGVPEWPPSPWRLLRALVAVWRRTCPDLPEAQVKRVLESLLAPPVFHLPSARMAHTRHYMPLEKKPSLVFDTFVATGRTRPNSKEVPGAVTSPDDPAIFIHWPTAELSLQDLEALAKLLENLTSLGRAESWVEATLTGQEVAWNCRPAETSDPNPVPVLCADPATALSGEHYPTHEARKLKRGLAPGDLLFDCPRWHLCLDTQTVHERRWPSAPGSVWVNYTRPDEGVSPPRSTVGARRTPATFSRFALDGPVLPLVTETLPLAERVRSRLLSLCKHLQGQTDSRSAFTDLSGVAPAFLGKDEGRRPLTGHQHAFFLPLDEDDDGRIDHVAVYAPMGFGAQELQALDRLRTLRFGEMELRLALVGLGVPADFARSRVLGPSATWESATPFLVTRHLKQRGRKRDPREWSQGPDGQSAFVLEVLREELERRDALEHGKFAGAEIEPIPDQRIGPRRLRSHEFHLQRKPGDNGIRRPRGAFRIRFPQPVQGPISLGQSCHFGLGLFLQAPLTDPTSR